MTVPIFANSLIPFTRTARSAIASSRWSPSEADTPIGGDSLSFQPAHTAATNCHADAAADGGKLPRPLSARAEAFGRSLAPAGYRGLGRSSVGPQWCGPRNERSTDMPKESNQRPQAPYRFEMDTEGCERC